MNTLWLSLPFGLLVSIFVWGLYSVFKNVPVEDRQFRDRPALGFRIVWPLIQAVAFHIKYKPTNVRIESTLV